MSAGTLAWMSLAVGGWAVGNGILHDLAVVKDHFKEYDRNFLYYLLNGHIIIVTGLFEMISFSGIMRGEIWGLYVSGTAALSMVIYCIMIWKFLPSILTIILQSGLLTVLVLHYVHIL